VRRDRGARDPVARHGRLSEPIRMLCAEGPLGDVAPPVHTTTPALSGRPALIPRQIQRAEPERYPEDVQKVLASGKTPAACTSPSWCAKSCAAFDRRRRLAVDCTLGGGGHGASDPGAGELRARVSGLDIDPLSLPRACGAIRTRRVRLAAGELGGLPKSVGRRGAAQRVDLFLADLGVSSMQLTIPNRASATRGLAPSTMRMNPFARWRPRRSSVRARAKEERARLLEEQRRRTGTLNLHRTPSEEPATLRRTHAGRPGVGGCVGAPVSARRFRVWGRPTSRCPFAAHPGPANCSERRVRHAPMRSCGRCLTASRQAVESRS